MNTLNVLIVDDDPGMREHLTRILGPHCEEIRQATTLQEAFTVLNQMESCAVIILDLKIPGSPDGRATIDSIPSFKSLHPGCIVLVVTGMYDSEEIRKACLDAGADIFTPKDENLFREKGLIRVFLKAVEQLKLEHPETPDFVHHVKALRNILQAFMVFSLLMLSTGCSVMTDAERAGWNQIAQQTVGASAALGIQWLNQQSTRGYSK